MSLDPRTPTGSPASALRRPSAIAATDVSNFATDLKLSMEDFDLLAVVGKGSFGKVLQVQKKGTSEIYALKILKKKVLIARNQVEHTKTERRVMQSVRHPFIVRLHGAFQTESKLYFLMDYVGGGELFFHLKKEGKFSEERVMFYAAELVMAIEHLHKCGIMYRDLKPENILLQSDGHICITDFGLSKQLKPETNHQTHTFCGTPEYLAPEVLQGAGHGISVDWWSLGTLIYEMLTGLPPFYSTNINIMYERILQGELKFPPHVSQSARSLLTALLQRDPALRLGGSVSGGEEIKSHPFFQDIDWAALFRKEMSAPWRPVLKGVRDLRNIDPLFTHQQAIDSVEPDSEIKSTATFENFTFVASEFPQA